MWPHLYQERVAHLFAGGLYWQRFADVRENRANLCFSAKVGCPRRARALPGLESVSERKKTEWRM